MGKLALFCVAISVLCSCLTAVNIPVDTKFDPTKLSGKWYPVLSISYHLPPPKNVFAFKAKSLGNGAFVAKIEVPENGTCRVSKFNLNPIKPGSFQTKDKKSFVYIIETDYQEHLLSVFKTYITGVTNVLQLFVRNPKAPLKWKKKFNQIAKELGYNAKELDFTRAALCKYPPKD